MHILIDECLDWRLCRAVSGLDCTTVQKMGWTGLANGVLLKKAEDAFDVFLTGDRNLTFQQDLHRFRIAVIVLHAPSTQLQDTEPLMAKVAELLSTAPSGEVTDVYA